MCVHMTYNSIKYSPVLQAMPGPIEPTGNTQGGEEFMTEEWKSQFDRQSGWDWATSSRVREERGRPQTQKRPIPRLSSAEGRQTVPNGPAGPDGLVQSKADPGRPDWARMLAGELGEQPSTSHSGSESDSTSEVRCACLK